MIFKVKATETWKWEQEIEAKDEKELEQILENEYTEYFDSNAADYSRDLEIVKEEVNG